MKRTAGAFLVAIALGGCMSSGHRQGPAGNGCGSCGSHAAVPGVQGPWGQPVERIASPGGPAGKPMKAALSKDVVQASHMGTAGAGVVPATHHGHVAVPPPPYGAVAAAGALQPGMHAHMGPKRTEVRFVQPPEGSAVRSVRWMVAAGPDGRQVPSSQPLIVPGSYNFLQGAVYRLKLETNDTELPTLYPTLEVVPSNARTDAFLAHSSVPVGFTLTDLQQVKAGHYVTKVIYLPDPQFQDLVTTGPQEIVSTPSTPLEPGADPIAEAHRRGSILVIVRFGNIDLGLQHTPAVGGSGPMGSMPAGGAPGAVPLTQNTQSGGIMQVGHQTVQPAKEMPAKEMPAAKSQTTGNPSKGLRWWNFK